MKGKLIRTWKKQVVNEGIKIGFSRVDALC